MINTNRLGLAKIIVIKKSDKYENNVKIKHNTRLILVDKDYDKNINKTAIDIESNKRLDIVNMNIARTVRYIMDTNEYGLVYNKNIYNVNLISDIKLLKDLDIKLPRFLNEKYLKYLASSVNKEATDDLAKKLVLNKKFINRTKNKVK